MSDRPSARALAGVRAALVDLDGTLLDTVPDLAAAANAMLAQLGLAPVEPAQVRDFVGRGIAALVERCLRASIGREPEPELFSRAQAAFAAHYERENGRRAAPYPGVLEGLSAMREKGLRLACVTNKPSRFTLPLLEGAVLAPFFDAVMTADIAGARKPDPAIFLAACRRLAVAPQEACAIGDSANDAEGARAAGCRVLLVPYGYREGRALGEIVSDGVVATLAEAAGFLCP
ncbi:MAG: phosphoglycolate phosphatase [Burkholderiales bacterium]|nr:phosphoglycolate phosphatase [Burkholderiales bacterium]